MFSKIHRNEVRSFMCQFISKYPQHTGVGQAKARSSSLVALVGITGPPALVPIYSGPLLPSRLHINRKLTYDSNSDKAGTQTRAFLYGIGASQVTCLWCQTLTIEQFSVNWLIKLIILYGVHVWVHVCKSLYITVYKKGWLILQKTFKCHSHQIICVLVSIFVWYFC